MILDDGRNVLDGAGKIFSGTRGIFDGEQRISRARNTFSRPNEGGETASGVAMHAAEEVVDTEIGHQQREEGKDHEDMVDHGAL